MKSFGFGRQGRCANNGARKGAAHLLAERSGMRTGLFGLAIGALLSLPLASTPALALDPAPSENTQAPERAFPESGEVLMQADNLSYDKDKKIAVATGNVEAAYGQRVLLADKVTYDENTGIVTADGNVALLEPGGDVAFSDHAVLKNELKDGVVHTLRMLLNDKSRLAGNDAVRTNGESTTLHRGVYSPCEPCEGSRAAPIWQLKAFRVIHDKQRKQIIYEDAFMEIFGIPVFYTPFFSHPDPSVKRKSGFLIPSTSSSTDFGQEFVIPYYWVIAPNIDATFIPRFTTKNSIIYQTEYRHRFEAGQMQFFATGTWPEKRVANTAGEKRFRGSLFGYGAFDLAPNWTWGFQSQLVTDDTYLRKYRLSDENDLTSNLHLNYVDGRESFSVNGYFFQSLIPGVDSSDIPWVAPLVDYRHSFNDLFLGGRVDLQANTMWLQTPSGLGSRRFTTSLHWERPYIAPGGQVFRFFGTLRGDLYSTEEAPRMLNGIMLPTKYGKEFIARALPTIGVEASYPFVNTSSWRQVIEPITQLIYSPNIGNTDRIPNMDSLTLEFDESNLFSENRFPGFDRWETGARASAGIRYSIYAPGGAKASVLFGQSYRSEHNRYFSQASGLRETVSDYVGSVQISPNESIVAMHRFRLDRDTFKFKRNEIDVYGRIGPLVANVGYAYFSADQATFLNTGAREQVNVGGVLKLSEYWRLFGNAVHNTRQGGQNTAEFGVGYQDDCFGLAVGFYRSNVTYQDIEPSNTFLIQITFKNLGTTGSGQNVRRGAATAGIINPGSTLFGPNAGSMFGDPFGFTSISRRRNGL